MMTHDILARMSLGSLKHPGLAVVYESLLGFAGDEFYTAWVKINSKLQNENLMHLVLFFLYISCISGLKWLGSLFLRVLSASLWP